MILPTKHIRSDRSLIGVGGQMLDILQEPMTVSRLWDEIRVRRSVDVPYPVIDYRWFVLALDLLYTIRAVNLERGLIHKAES